MKHFKETEEGHEIMCESVEKYGNERVIKANVKSEERVFKKFCVNFLLTCFITKEI